MKKYPCGVVSCGIIITSTPDIKYGAENTRGERSIVILYVVVLYSSKIEHKSEKYNMERECYWLRRSFN